MSYLAVLTHYFACIFWMIGSAYHKARAVAHRRQPPSSLTLPHLRCRRTHPRRPAAARPCPASPPTQRTGQSWFSTFEGVGTVRQLEQSSVWNQYLVSFYWVATVLSTSGLIGDLNPSNQGEVIFTCVTMVVNITVFSYVLGQIAMAVEKQDEALVAKREKILSVETMVTMRKLPPDISAEIRQHFDYMAASSQGGAADAAAGEEKTDVFALLSHSLQVEVAKHMSRGLLSQISAFADCEPQFLDSVSVLLREVNVSPDSYLFRVNDVPQELNIIAAGVIEITVDSLDEGEKIIATKGVGEMVGDVSFFFGIRQTTHARTPHNSVAQLFALGRESYQELVKLFPEQEQRITRNCLSMFDSGAGGLNPNASQGSSRVSGRSGASGRSGGSGMSHATVDQAALDGLETLRKVLEIAKKKKKTDRIVSLVAAAAEANLDELVRIMANSDINVNDGECAEPLCLDGLSVLASKTELGRCRRG